MKPVAYAALVGVGDKSHEFSQYTGYGFHLRRRLTLVEQTSIGDAVDCRGSAEGVERLCRIAHMLPRPALEMARQELYGIGTI